MCKKRAAYLQNGLWVVLLGCMTMRVQAMEREQKPDSRTLFVAAEKGNLAGVSLDLFNKKDLNYALSLAAYYGHVDAARTLLDGGAYAKANHGDALRKAENQGKVAVVELLLNRCPAARHYLRGEKAQGEGRRRRGSRG